MEEAGKFIAGWIAALNALFEISGVRFSHSLEF